MAMVTPLPTESQRCSGWSIHGRTLRDRGVTGQKASPSCQPPNKVPQSRIFSSLRRRCDISMGSVAWLGGLFVYGGPALSCFLARIGIRPLLLVLFLVSCVTWMTSTTLIAAFVAQTATLKSKTDFFTAVFICAVFHELMLTAAFDVTRRS